MKIKTTTVTTEIECSAEELRQSNSVADAFMNVFRRAFNGPVSSAEPEYFDDDDEESEE